MIKIYTYNYFEFENDYILNNSILKSNQTQAFYLPGSSGVAYLEKLKEEKLKNKEFESVEVGSYTLLNNGNNVYLLPKTVDVGTYRFKIVVDAVTYYTDLFCVKNITYTGINELKSGLLKVYDKDYFENGGNYILNNSILNNSGITMPFYFDTGLNIDSFSCELMKLDENKLKVRDFFENKIKDVTLLQDDSKLYLKSLISDAGIYRYRITVNSEVFYSDIFKICETDIISITFDSTLITFDSTLITFDNG